MNFKDFIYKKMGDRDSFGFFYDYIEIDPYFSEKSITFDFLENLKKEALDRYANNTAIAYFIDFKHAIYRAISEGYKLPLSYDDILKTLYVQPQASEHVYLNVDELNLLELYKPTTKIEDFTKNVFLLCAYTGCRLNDYPLINESAFDEDDKELFYSSNKTQRTSRLRLHPLVPELAKNLKAYQYSADTAKALVARGIKAILRKIGNNLEDGNSFNKPLTLFQRGARMTRPKYAFVSSHTARRSFATNLYLDGFDIKNISRMMGHSTTIQTERYIVVSHSDYRTNTKTYLLGGEGIVNQEANDWALNEYLKGLGLTESDRIAMADLIKKLRKEGD